MDDQNFIMVVEDDEGIRCALVESVRDMGHRAVGFSDGVGALAYLLGDGPKPRLILLDLMMPNKTGWELIEDMKKHGIYDDVTIKIITATGSKISGIGILKKPFQFDDLIEIVEAVMS